MYFQKRDYFFSVHLIVYICTKASAIILLEALVAGMKYT
jgi:hypothetical protein